MSKPFYIAKLPGNEVCVRMTPFIRNMDGSFSISQSTALQLCPISFGKITGIKLKLNEEKKVKLIIAR